MALFSNKLSETWVGSLWGIFVKKNISIYRSVSARYMSRNIYCIRCNWGPQAIYAFTERKPQEHKNCFLLLSPQ